ncbi:MAG TPA: acyl-CoA dehydrogenase family protein [Frankiaceae bacterium]|nr:acyl-CoA dehydrogenase family protein [Frankiaceae bacterium]
MTSELLELQAVARKMLADSASWSALADAGWPGLEVAAELGGSGVTFAETAVLLQEMGRSAAANPYFGTVALGVGALNLLARPDTGEWLAAIAAGELRVAVALPAGDSTDLSLQLVREGRSLRLSGSADFVMDAAQTGRLLVAARTSEGEPVMVALTPAQPGVQIAEQPVVDATRSFGVVTASAAPVNADAVWSFRADPERSLRLLLDRGALAVACDCLGLAEAMLDATVAYAGVRQQFGRYIGSFQAVKHQCADMLVQITIGRELLAAAVVATVADEHDSWVAVSMAKSFLGTLAVDVAGKAMQLHGGFGYTWESGVHTYLKRAVLNRALFGSPAAHRARLATRYP